MQRFDEFAAKPEKALYAALRETQAGDDQRARILGAYDQHQLRLEALQTEAAAIMDAWRQLDRRDPAFTERAGQLAEKWSAVCGQQLAEVSAFDQQVAAALDEAQWHTWQEFWSNPEAGQRIFHSDQDGESQRRSPGRRR